MYVLPLCLYVAYVTLNANGDVSFRPKFEIAGS